MKNVCLSEVLWRFKLRLNTVRHVTSIGPSITPVSTLPLARPIAYHLADAKF